MIKSKNVKKLIIIIISVIILSFAFTSCVFAEGEGIEYSKSSEYGELKNVTNLSNASFLAKISGQIIGIIYVVATVVAIVMLLIIGIKYMMAAPDQKANLKARAIPYLIGAALVFGAANVLKFIEKISTTWVK